MIATPIQTGTFLPAQAYRPRHGQSTQGKDYQVYDEMSEMARSLARLETSVIEIKTALSGLVPKIEDVHGFVKHGASALATKEGLTKLESDLTAEIIKRPTRRQALVDIGLIVGLIGGALTIGSKVAR